MMWKVSLVILLLPVTMSLSLAQSRILRHEPLDQDSERAVQQIQEGIKNLRKGIPSSFCADSNNLGRVCSIIDCPTSYMIFRCNANGNCALSELGVCGGLGPT